VVQQSGGKEALAFVTAAGVVLASFITVILAIYVARRQMRATVVSANRQR
jgi:hypothetical protein